MTIGFRRSWAGFLTDKLVDKVNSMKVDDGNSQSNGYYFLDANVKLDYKISQRLKGYTHFYYSTDRMSMGDEESYLQEDSESAYTETDQLRLKWGNFGVDL